MQKNVSNSPNKSETLNIQIEKTTKNDQTENKNVTGNDITLNLAKNDLVSETLNEGSLSNVDSVYLWGNDVKYTW